MASLPVVLEDSIRWRVAAGPARTPMVRASSCLLAGMLVPQLSSFPRYSDLFRALNGLPGAPGHVALCIAALAILLRTLPVRARSDLLWFGAGLLLFCVQVESVAQSRLDARYTGDSIVTTIRIVDFPRVTPAGVAFAAAADDGRLPRRLRLTWFEAPVSLRIGDVWGMELRLKPPHGGANPGSMDYETWLLRERVGATGYVVDGTRNRLLDSGRHDGIARVREHFVSRLRAAVPRAEEAAVLAALVVGARHLLSDEQWERYARTGTSHLMAISGLHIGLAAAGTYGVLAILLGLPGGQRNHHAGALAASVLVAIAYAVVSGFAVPARRASLMLALLAAALLGRRQPELSRILAAAALVVLCADPLSVLAPGFLLSFAAVAVLLWFARRTGPKPATRRRRAAASLAGLVRVQFMLLAGLAALTVMLFDRLSLAAPAMNVVAVPLFSAVTVPFGLLGFALDGPFAPLGDSLLRGSAHSIALLERLLVVAASSELASWPVAGRERIAWLYLLVPALWAMLPPGWPGRWVAWLGLAGLLAFRPAAPPPGCVFLTVLDVGQGLSVVGRTAQHAFVYDTGPVYRSGRTAAEQVLLPYLVHAGIRRVDRLVVSHSDLDHAGGLAAVARAVRVRHIVSGDRVSLPDRSIGRCRAGTEWRWDGIRFRFLHPPADFDLGSNDASCVLLIAAGPRRALLAGDIEAPVESRLVQARVLPTVDVTTVPHHGSTTSSIVPYLRSLEANFAIVSAARYNQWGLPKEEIVERWRNVGAEVLNTADNGAVEVRLCADAPHAEVKAWRVEQRKLWHPIP